MADLRSRFIEDYAGGLLNVSRQELSSSGEVASQDGLPTDGGTLFVEDGTGTKSGLRLGASMAEVVDPTTESGCVNVRFADKTYAKLRDLKLFTTAVASAQAALSEACSTSITNLETTLQLLETDISSLQQSIQSDVYDTRNKLEDVILIAAEVSSKTKSLEDSDVAFTSELDDVKGDVQSLQSQLTALSATVTSNGSSVNGAINSINTTLSSFDNRLILLEDYKAEVQVTITNILQRLDALENPV